MESVASSLAEATEDKEVPVETPQNSAETTTSATEQSAKTHHQTGKRWGIPFTKENSAEMARRAQAARKQREAEEELARAQSADTTSADDATYRKFRLIRTREQLLALDKQLEAERDPKLVKSLADAIARLCDVEQRLAMRPLPGSRRPGREKPDKRSAASGPLDAE